MDLDTQTANPNEPLRFYCRDCDIVFDSLPDGTGYEQAPCPQCREVCLTIGFEQEEIQRNRNEATFFSFLGSIAGLFSFNIPSQQEQPNPAAPMTIVRYEDRLLAEADAEYLRQSSIQATLAFGGAGKPAWFSGPNVVCIELQVPAADARRAEQILREKEPALIQIEPQRNTSADVTFACDDCGETITFPGKLRGKVEVCPHCQSFVDVPED